MLTNLRHVLQELVVQPLLHWLTRGTHVDGSMDRLALADWALHPDDPGPTPPQEPSCLWAHGPVDDLDAHGLCPVCAEDDGERDPDLTAGVDPRSGLPLEQSGVNVRLRP